MDVSTRIGVVTESHDRPELTFNIINLQYFQNQTPRFNNSCSFVQTSPVMVTNLQLNTFNP